MSTEVHEHDIEGLEELLDGEMPDADANALRARVAAEPALSAAFERLRAERDIRRQMWRAFEPDESQIFTFVSVIRTAVRKGELRLKRARALRYVSGLAACLLLGFLFGKFVPFGNVTPRDRGTGIIFDNSSAGGGAMEVLNNGNRAARQAVPGGFKVLLTDSYGNVLGEQRFNSFDEAREFTQDLGRMQRRNQQPPRNAGNDVKLIKGEF
jgi:hypothetical protein